MRKNWRKYNGALISNFPPHKDVDTQNLISKIKDSKALFARWVSDFDCKEEMPFWYIIKDNNTDIESYSSNTRNQIRKGIKNCEVRIIDKSELEKHGYSIYKAAFKTYKGSQKLRNKRDFLISLGDEFHYWGVYNKENRLIGYAQNRISYNSCDYSTIKVHPDFLKDYPFYALFYLMNQYYLSKLKLAYVSDGARSISHQTNIQDFLVKKFKFREAYCNLHVVYHPFIRPIVMLLFSIRKVLVFFPFNLFTSINTILIQEEIRRNCKIKKTC
ncbi:MAG: hypothetical protein VX762_02225 [Bacteroidota bacterium]|nr:hypothetical protein [Bacteroidota bacterium]